MPTSRRATDTGGYLCYTRAAQARSASRRIDAGAMRKHRAGFFRFIREVKDSDMLAAFFGYFLSPATESTPPEAYRVARGAVCGGTHGPCRGVRYNRRTGSSVPTDDMRVCASPGRRGEGAPPYGVQQEVQWFGSSRTPPPTSGLQAVQGQDDAHIVPYGRG